MPFDDVIIVIVNELVNKLDVCLLSQNLNVINSRYWLEGVPIYEINVLLNHGQNVVLLKLMVLFVLLCIAPW